MMKNLNSARFNAFVTTRGLASPEPLHLSQGSTGAIQPGGVPPNRRRPATRRNPYSDRMGFCTFGPIAMWLMLAAASLCLSGCGPLGLENAARNGGGAVANAAESPATNAVDATPALTLEGRTITVGDLHRYMQEQFLEELLSQPEGQVFELREKAAQEMVQRHVIETTAADRGLSPEDLYLEITSKAGEPTVEDVSNWYTGNQQRLRGAPLEEVAGQIRDMLANERKGRAWAEFVQPKMEALDWKLEMEPPRVQLAATRLVRGRTEAPVTIMAFSDYQCPYCIRSEPVLNEVLKRYPQDVRVIHRHFPLDSIHPFARPAAEAAMCADEQGKYWEFHDAIFARNGRLADGSITEIGQELGLDEEALSTCVSERRFRSFVEADVAAGEKAGVTGTPAFFVNGIPLKGARDADGLSRIVERELARINSN